jgi:protein TonB
MSKRLFAFILISIIIHLIILAQIRLENKGDIKEDQPIVVDIIKKQAETKKPSVNTKILSNRDLNLKKKNENIKRKNENDISNLQVKKDKIRGEENLANQILSPKKEEVKKEEKVTQRNSKVAIPKDNKERKNEIKKVIETNENDKNQVQSIDKEKVKNILKPSEILSELAKNEVSNVKEGVDEVNIEAMKFKYYSYFYKFKRLLYQVWEYPTKSIYNGEEGIVRIRFSILRDGTITNVRIVESSGYPDLDSAAVKALKTMKGVPLPDSYKLNILHVDGYFAYNIYRMRIY